MQNSSGEEDNSNWIFYKDRDEWKDVKPLPQEDYPYPVVKICYSPKFEDVFDYFRAIVHNDERSARALELINDAIELNPSNYTVWNYRRILIKSLNKDLLEELVYIDEIITEHPKNYQVWHHRQVIVEWLNNGSLEKDLTARILKIDAKNYHAWQHRQWAIRNFNLWEGELEFVSELLKEDIRNNSAWNQRYFIVKNTTTFTEEVIQKELKFVIEAIEKTSSNESPWNYLRGILEDKGLTYFPEVVQFVEELYEKPVKSARLKSPFLLAFYVDILEEKIKDNEDNEILLQKALEILEDLANIQDPIRKKYWNYLAQNLIVKYKS